MRRLLLACACLGPLTAAAAGAEADSSRLAATLDGVTATEGGSQADRRAAVARLGADRWHAAGWRGRGVKVLVLDSGFRGYRDHLGTALPARVIAQSFRRDGDLESKHSQHGILCGEVVHALAPEAELLLANWEPDDPQQFLAAVRWARAAGATVVTCSVITPCWSDGEGGGPVHAALSAALGHGDRPEDALFFACAGNTAQRHWAGAYRPGEQGWHEWSPGRSGCGVTPWGDERVSVELCWPGEADYELVVRDRVTGVEVAAARPTSGGQRHSAVARFHPRRGTAYEASFRRTAGQASAVHLVALGGGMEYATARGSIPFPGDGPEVVAVGAVDGEGRRIGYSGCGSGGRPPKPDLVARVPFPSGWRERPFSGTSAAAPQAAGLAALWWSRQPTLRAGQVREALANGALDLGPPGPDAETGHGHIRLP